ncbi:DUF4007 family protein [Imperialibacter roseus]|uniref:DUF4007 family protein n=1 Tax=Imperialibacter roseus TaxID=1324217 RepID=A0ABZ0IKK0_9BACT|nr:DUF4007 family protein [Imperialibacter roseus]WOK05066.1 DUF4007 family protein [Imperialibacter roseus]
MSQTLRFSGHESFQCRFYWLKKGYDFIQENGDFSSDDAPVKLGVGKNMVTAIRYWLKAFGVFDHEVKEISPLASKIFDSNTGWDPYLEDEGTLWLLHYFLIKNDYASSYGLIFNDLRKKRPDFNFKHFETSVEQAGGSVASNTLKTDFQIFSRTYIPRDDSKDLDESYSGLLTELGLVSKFKKDKTEYFSIEPKRKRDIPVAIFLYCLLESTGTSNSVSFDSVYSDGVGSTFALTRDGLTEMLEKLAESYQWITFSNEAGIKELQFSKQVAPFDILKEYYEG